MSREFNHNKLEEICDFIIEVSKGNFTLQLNSKNSGELEPLIMLHNMMNEELNTLFHHIHSGKSNPEVILLTILISKKMEIRFISSQSLKYLGLDNFPGNIKEILTTNSSHKLHKLLKKYESQLPKKKYKLDFRTKEGLLLKTNAELQLLQNIKGTSGILIIAFKVTYRNKKLEKYRNRTGTILNKYPTRNRSILLQENREMIEKLRDYLLKNLDQKFPGIKELAKTFNASESKLKKGFKHYYGTSIYKFVQKKRFQKAHLLLTETERPISAIAQDCGFVSPAHFSRSFKERFGYRPSDVQRNPE